MELLKCYVLLQVLACSAGSYFHELSMTTLQPPRCLHDDCKWSNDSFFGYSITYDRQSRSLIASAPRADLDGQVFSCDINTKNCFKLNVTSGETVSSSITNRMEGTNYHAHHFWLGATVKADSKNLLVCAPRHTENLKAENSNKHEFVTFGTAGRCYVKDLTPIEPQKFEILPTMKATDRGKGATRNENLTDSFGWSIDIAEDHSVRVGGPAMSAGRMLTYSKPSSSRTPKLLNGFATQEQVAFNFGYSIATGNFFKSNDKYVAVSTPYGEVGKGKVLFFDAKSSNYRWTIYDKNEAVGALFGAALCSARLNKLSNQSTSLLIGAPAFFIDTPGQHQYHTGVVFVYVPSSQTKIGMVFKKKIDGQKDGGFFGASIANVGDMDKDKLDEIVIAAPYEDNGKGAVYLYSGSALASELHSISWLQRFQPKEFMNFGLSLSALQFSDNGCNDLAIGAPGNDKVAVYHCIPSVTVRLDARFPNLQKRLDKTNFVFDSCLKVEYPDKLKDIKAKFRVTVRITHPNATFSDKTKDYESYEVALQRDKTDICKPIKVLTSKNGDYEQDIQFGITAELLDDPALSKAFDSTKATVSNHSILAISPTVRAADCKNERCEPNISLEVKFTAANNYLIGSTAAETLQVIVKNGDGDTAYRPCARITVEGDVTVLRTPAACVFDSLRQRTCQLQGPLASNSKWNIGAGTAIELDMTSLTSESRDMRVSVEVFNRCNTTAAPADNHTILVTFKRDTSGVRVEGKTDQGEIVNLTRSDVNVFGKTIHHTYTISNTRGTNWKSPNCKVFLKKNPFVEFQYNIIQVYRDHFTNKRCESRDLLGDNGVVELTCDIGDLFKEDIITVVIPYFVPPGKLGDEISETKHIKVHTELSLHFDSENKDIGQFVTTTLTLQEALLVPIWIIVVAVLVGMLLLFLLAFALYECGFLRRKNREKLEGLKTDVKRKTMILHRRSMRLSDDERAALANRPYRELLDEAEAKEAEEGTEVKINDVEEDCRPTASRQRRALAKRECPVRQPDDEFKNQIEMSLKKKLLT